MNFAISFNALDAEEILLPERDGVAEFSKAPGVK